MELDTDYKLGVTRADFSCLHRFQRKYKGAETLGMFLVFLVYY